MVGLPALPLTSSPSASPTCARGSVEKEGDTQPVTRKLHDVVDGHTAIHDKPHCCFSCLTVFDGGYPSRLLELGWGQ